MRNNHQPTPALEIFQCTEEAVPAGERLFGSGLSGTFCCKDIPLWSPPTADGHGPQGLGGRGTGWGCSPLASPAGRGMGMGKAQDPVKCWRCWEQPGRQHQTDWSEGLFHPGWIWDSGIAPGQVQHLALCFVGPHEVVIVPLFVQVPVHGQILPGAPVPLSSPIPCKHAEGELASLPVSLGKPQKRPRAKAEPWWTPPVPSLQLSMEPLPTSSWLHPSGQWLMPRVAHSPKAGLCRVWWGCQVGPWHSGCTVGRAWATGKTTASQSSKNSKPFPHRKTAAAQTSHRTAGNMETSLASGPLPCCGRMMIIGSQHPRAVEGEGRAQRLPVPVPEAWVEGQAPESLCASFPFLLGDASVGQEGPRQGCRARAGPHGSPGTSAPQPGARAAGSSRLPSQAGPAWHRSCRSSARLPSLGRPMHGAPGSHWLALARTWPHSLSCPAAPWLREEKKNQGTVFGWELPQVKRDTGREEKEQRNAGKKAGHEWQPAEKVALWKPNQNLWKRNGTEIKHSEALFTMLFWETCARTFPHSQGRSIFYIKPEFHPFYSEPNKTQWTHLWSFS